MFSVLLHSFHKWFSVDQHFLSSFTPTRISKVHASWRFKQTRNFKDFLHALHQSGFFRFWRDTDPENNFFEVRSSLLLRHPVIENCLFQCAVKQPIKLMSWTIFFCAITFYKKNSIFCRWNKSTCDFIPHLFVSIFLRFGAHSPVHLWQV